MRVSDEILCASSALNASFLESLNVKIELLFQNVSLSKDDVYILIRLKLHFTCPSFFQRHTAVSRIIEATEKVSFPNKERVLQAYLHFEALTEHDYTFAYVSCGYSTAVAVMDLHKKAVFKMPCKFLIIKLNSHRVSTCSGLPGNF